MKKKFLAIYFILTFITCSLMGIIFNRMMKDHYLYTAYHNAITESKFMSAFLDENKKINLPIFRLVQFFASKSDYRVTFLTSNGQPVADSKDNSIIFTSYKNIDNIEFNKRHFPFYRTIKKADNKYQTIEIFIQGFKINNKNYILMLSKDLTMYRNFRRKILFTITFSFIISGIVTIFLSIFIINKAIKPINRLIKATKDISNGKFNTPIKIKADTEIEELAKNFNSMQAKIAFLLKTIEEKANNLQIILDNLKTSIFVINPYGNIILINKSAVKEFNLKDKFDNLYSYSELDFVLEDIENAIEKKKNLNIKINNEEKTYRILLNYIKSDTNQIIITAENITKYENNEKLRKEFISSASHELKTPITIISGFIETIKLGHVKDMEQLNSFLDIIENETKRLSSLTNNLLKLSNSENSLKEKKEQYKINLKDIGEQIITTFSKVAEKKNIDIISNIDNLSVVSYISEEWLRIVLGNIIDNSIKYSPQNTNIYVNIEDKDKKILISVKDEGIGIEEDELKNIFRRFYRVDKSRNRKINGNGLGLSIVKNLVTKANGKIKVYSKPNIGTKFVISIPKIKI